MNDQKGFLKSEIVEAVHKNAGIKADVWNVVFMDLTQRIWPCVPGKP